MTRADAGALVAVEVFVKQHQVAPVWVALELFLIRRKLAGCHFRRAKRSDISAARFHPRLAILGFVEHSLHRTGVPSKSDLGHSTAPRRNKETADHLIFRRAHPRPSDRRASGPGHG